MAGSYSHIKNGGWEMIETLGDAYEAVEELLFIVEHQPQDSIESLLNQFYAIKRREAPESEVYKKVQKLMSGEEQ